MIMDVTPIVQAECEDCEEVTLVVDSTMVSVMRLEDNFTGVTICQYCFRPIITPISDVLAASLETKGVKILSWD